MSKRVSWLLVGLALAAAPVMADPPAPAPEADAKPAEAAEQPWVRLVENDKRVVSLEIASREFRRTDGQGPTVTLYGAVHIAEPEFYAAIQKELDAYDLVLFEGVNGGEPVGADAPKKDACRRPVVASLVARPDDKHKSDGLQARMARSLGLTFQLDQMDHTRANWRNSDMSIQEIEAAVEAEGGDASQLLGMLDGSSAMAAMANMMFTMIELIPGGSERGRLVIMHLLPEADDMLSNAMPGGEALMKVIIGERNQRVVDDLKKAMSDDPNKRIAIIYGAGHMGDMTDKLLDQLQLAPDAMPKWRPAMTLDLEKAGITKSEQMMTRIMIKKQIYQMKKMAEMRQPAVEEAPAEPAGATN